MNINFFNRYTKSIFKCWSNDLKSEFSILWTDYLTKKFLSDFLFTHNRWKKEGFTLSQKPFKRNANSYGESWNLVNRFWFL